MLRFWRMLAHYHGQIWTASDPARSLGVSEPTVRRYLDTDTPVLRPGQPLVTAMFYLFHGRNFLPVVEPASGLLVGVISAWDILDSILPEG